MSYSKVRTYLKQQILNVSSSFKEHDDAFNEDNIPRSNFNKAFHIAYSVPSINRNDVLVESNIAATISFYFKGYKDAQTILDSSMDTVNEIALNCGKIESLNAFRITDQYPIQSCTPSSQTVEPLESNDNAIVITLELNMSVYQTLC